MFSDIGGRRPLKVLILSLVGANYIMVLRAF